MVFHGQMGRKSFGVYHPMVYFMTKKHEVGRPLNSLQWRLNERDGVSNHQPHDCLRKGLLGCSSKNTPKLRVTGLCDENSPVTGEFPAQRARNAEKFPFDDVFITGTNYTAGPPSPKTP